MPDKEEIELPFKCPHCGSIEEPWFDRSYTVDSKGNEIEGMAYRCVSCGKKTD